MDTHLAKSPHGYMVGDRVTIADIVSWGWVSAHCKPFSANFIPTSQHFPSTYFCPNSFKPRFPSTPLIHLTNSPFLIAWAGVSLQDCPNVEKWLHMLLKRPGFDKGRHVPTPHTYMDDDKMTAEALEERAAKGREWVQKSMAADAK